MIFLRYLIVLILLCGLHAENTLPCNTSTSVNVKIDEIAYTKWRLILTNDEESRDECDWIQLIPNSNTPTSGVLFDSNDDEKGTYNWTLTNNGLNLSIPVPNLGTNILGQLVFLFFNNESKSTCFAATFCFVPNSLQFKDNVLVVACDEPNLSENEIQSLKDQVTRLTNSTDLQLILQKDCES
ncbi:hypothetical protein CHUAL_013772 [Chamberlinius hualienensis]